MSRLKISDSVMKKMTLAGNTVCETLSFKAHERLLVVTLIHERLDEVFLDLMELATRVLSKSEESTDKRCRLRWGIVLLSEDFFTPQFRLFYEPVSLS